jgi:hypothetical protein
MRGTREHLRSVAILYSAEYAEASDDGNRVVYLIIQRYRLADFRSTFQICHCLLVDRVIYSTMAGTSPT